MSEASDVDGVVISSVDADINAEVCLWMSFCDQCKPEGSQFLGVIITNAFGMAHAVDKTHALGINPGGEIQAYEIHSDVIKPEHLDRLLDMEDLRKAGYID